MNVLALIQARLKKAARIAAAQKASLVYRGVPYAKARGKIKGGAPPPPHIVLWSKGLCPCFFNVGTNA